MTCLNDWNDVVLIGIVNQQLYSCWLFAGLGGLR
jgi:hypothetical protein